MRPNKYCRLTYKELLGHEMPVADIAQRLACFDRDRLLDAISAMCACLRDRAGTGGCIDADRKLLALLAPRQMASSLEQYAAFSESKQSQTAFPSRRVVFSAQQLLFLQQLLAGLAANPHGIDLNSPLARMKLLILALAVNDHLDTESSRLLESQGETVIRPENRESKLATLACELLPMNDVENLPDFFWLVCIYLRVMLDADEQRLFAADSGRLDFVTYCQQHYSLSPEELALFGFAWHCAYADKQEALLSGDPGVLVHPDMASLGRVLGPKADTFAQAISGTPEEISSRVVELHPAKWVREPRTPTHLYVRAFQERPFLRLGCNVYRPSFVTFVLDRTTRGILLDISEEKGKDNKARGDWGRFLGMLFEHQMREYFFELSKRCSKTAGCRVYAKPHLTGAGFKQPFGDAAVLQGKFLFAFEFKSHFMAKTLRFSPTPGSLGNDIRRDILGADKGQAQLASRIEEFLTGKGELEGLASSAVSKAYPIIVCLDTAYASPLINALACCLFFHASPGVQARMAGLTIMTPRDLSYVLSCLPELDLGTVLSERLSSDHQLFEPFWNLWQSLGLDDPKPQRDTDYYCRIKERLFVSISEGPASRG